MNRKLKLTLIILLIILISIISFVGVFIQKTKFMENILPEYQLGMDLRGGRVVTIEVSDETETVYYDKDGNVVDEEAEDGSSEEVPVNSEEILTIDNYNRTKEIIEKRLSDLGISEYLIRMNENDGTITVQMSEDSMTDLAAQFLYTKGDFVIENEDGQVLMDNSNIERVQVGYSTTTSGTAIYLNIEFNKDSVETLKEITNTYVTSEDEEGNDTSKEILLKIDGSTLLQTSFDTEITNGILQLVMGTSTDTDTIQTNIEESTNIAILLNNRELPIEYDVTQNRFIKSDITLENMMIPIIIAGVILIIAYVFLIIRYKKLGILAIISHIGYLALFLLIIRFTNLILTMEGICAILISAILNYILLIYILESLKKKDKDIKEYRIAFNKSMLAMIMILIPSIIIVVVLTFATWLPAYSFGTIIFWGVLLIALYNASITRILFLNSIKNK